jgi:hypothetical protein
VLNSESLENSEVQGKHNPHDAFAMRVALKRGG